MYTPRFTVVEDDAQIRSFVREIGTAQLVTVGVDGYPVATLLPITWTEDRVVAHFARPTRTGRTSSRTPRPSSS
jgi:transcriptional regulator